MLFIGIVHDNHDILSKCASADNRIRRVRHRPHKRRVFHHWSIKIFSHTINHRAILFPHATWPRQPSQANKSFHYQPSRATTFSPSAPRLLPRVFRRHQYKALEIFRAPSLRIRCRRHYVIAASERRGSTARLFSPATTRGIAPSCHDHRKSSRAARKECQPS